MHIHIGWPQGIYLAIFLLSAVYNVRGDKNWKDYLGSFTGIFGTLGLLYWGGFFG